MNNSKSALIAAVAFPVCVVGVFTLMILQGIGFLRLPVDSLSIVGLVLFFAIPLFIIGVIYSTIVSIRVLVKKEPGKGKAIVALVFCAIQVIVFLLIYLGDGIKM